MYIMYATCTGHEDMREKGLIADVSFRMQVKGASKHFRQ